MSPFLKTTKEVKQLTSDPDLVFNYNFHCLTALRYACHLKKGLTQKCAGLKNKINAKLAFLLTFYVSGFCHWQFTQKEFFVDKAVKCEKEWNKIVASWENWLIAHKRNSFID